MSSEKAIQFLTLAEVTDLAINGQLSNKEPEYFSFTSILVGSDDDGCVTVRPMKEDGIL